jgi:hypothetical protein
MLQQHINGMRRLTGQQRTVNLINTSAAYPAGNIRRWTMRSLRILETRVLDYQIERVEQHDHMDMPSACWYEVICPYTAAVLGTGSSRAEAEQIVIAFELASARRALAMNVGYRAA